MINFHVLSLCIQNENENVSGNMCMLRDVSEITTSKIKGQGNFVVRQTLLASCAGTAVGGVQTGEHTL